MSAGALDEDRAVAIEREAVLLIDAAVLKLARAAALLEKASKLTVAPVSNGAVEWAYVRALVGQYGAGDAGSYDVVVAEARERARWER